METYQKTLDYINSKIGNFKPEMALILGSGLSRLVDGLNGISLKYSKIPDFPTTNIEGHKGELLFCRIENKNCIVMQGRFHYYEGYDMKKVVYPIKIFKMLGAKTLFITNAAGATSDNYNTGDIMLINDHINFMGNNPLIGKNEDSLGTRFPDMSDCYSKEIQELSKKIAKKLNIDLKEGVYLAVSGPSYETKAEVKMFKMLGADAIGMSTVPEAIVANYLNMNVAAFSMISNYATGVSNNKLTHNEVLETGKITSEKLSQLIKEIIKNL